MQKILIVLIFAVFSLMTVYTAARANTGWDGVNAHGLDRASRVVVPPLCDLEGMGCRWRDT